MKLGPLEISWGRKQANLHQPESRGGWWPLIRDTTTGAWQTESRTLSSEFSTIATQSTVFACLSLISSDVAKMRLRLVKESPAGIWTEEDNAAFSPVLRKPNHYQTRIKFIEQWILSKLSMGNTYVLKERDERRVVVAMYVLDPQRVRPLIAPDGSVFYELKKDELAQLPQDNVIVPAREIIHDIAVPLYHPLVGIAPLAACALAAIQGQKIQTNSANLFANGARPSGILTAPGAIGNDQARDLKERWDSSFTGANVGKVAVLGDGLKFEQMVMTAVDAQLIEQLRWTSETICSAFHVPPYMVGVGPPPNYNNIQALSVQYYTQCIQAHVESLELVLDEGLGLAPDKVGDPPVRLGTEFDTNDLLRMDTPTLIASEDTAKHLKTPNESRRVLNLPPVAGGDDVYRQQQDYSLSALAKRDAAPPSTTPQPVAPMEPEPEMMDDEEEEATERDFAAFTKGLSEMVEA